MASKSGSTPKPRSGPRVFWESRGIELHETTKEDAARAHRIALIRDRDLGPDLVPRVVQQETTSSSSAASAGGKSAARKTTRVVLQHEGRLYDVAEFSGLGPMPRLGTTKLLFRPPLAALTECARDALAPNANITENLDVLDDFDAYKFGAAQFFLKTRPSRFRKAELLRAHMTQDPDDLVQLTSAAHLNEVMGEGADVWFARFYDQFFATDSGEKIQTALRLLELADEDDLAESRHDLHRIWERAERKWQAQKQISMT